MSTTNNFDGLLPVIGTFTITGPGGAPTLANIYGCEDVQLPSREVKRDTYTMINTARAGLEQTILGSQKSTSIETKLVFQTGNFAAIDAFVGVNSCAIALVVNSNATEPGISISAVGSIEKISFERWEDSKHAVYSLSLAVNAGWTFASV